MRYKPTIVRIVISISLCLGILFRDILHYLTNYTNYIGIGTLFLVLGTILYNMFLRKNPLLSRFILVFPPTLSLLFILSCPRWNKTVRLASFYVVLELNSPSVINCRNQFSENNRPTLCFTMTWNLEDDAYHDVVYSPANRLQEYGGTNSEDWVRMLGFIRTVGKNRLTMLSASSLGNGFYDIRVPYGAFEG